MAGICTCGRYSLRRRGPQLAVGPRCQGNTTNGALCVIQYFYLFPWQNTNRSEKLWLQYVYSDIEGHAVIWMSWSFTMVLEIFVTWLLVKVKRLHSFDSECNQCVYTSVCLCVCVCGGWCKYICIYVFMCVLVHAKKCSAFSNIITNPVCQHLTPTYTPTGKRLSIKCRLSWRSVLYFYSRIPFPFAFGSQFRIDPPLIRVGKFKKKISVNTS